MTIIRSVILLLIAYQLITACATSSPRSALTLSIESAETSRPTLPGYVVKRKDKAPRALVLVHGITGDGYSSWTNQSDTYWPDIMKDDPAFNGFDIYAYQYPTSAFGQCLPITDLANHMRTHLKNDGIFSEHEQVVFLAHSMGGLVTRQFLLRNREMVNKVPLVMFFATPTGGSWKANAASLLSTCSQVDDLRKMDVNSYLKSQQSDWLSGGLQERVVSYCAFETQTSGGSLTVDRSSATLLCTKDPEALPTNHSNAVKPNSQSDLSHIIVRNALKDLPSPRVQNLGSKQNAIFDLLITKYPVTNPAIREPAERFIRYWMQVIFSIRSYKNPDLQLVMEQSGGPPRKGPLMKERIAQAEFTLDCLEREGYIRINKTTALGKWYAEPFDNLGFEFVAEKQTQFLEALQ